MAKHKTQKKISKKIQAKTPSKKKTQQRVLKFISKSKLRAAAIGKIFKQPAQVPQNHAKSTLDRKAGQSKLVSLVGRDNLNCPICLDYCIYPVLTQCGHYYCLQCFESAHKRSAFCCVCRGSINIYDYKPSAKLQNLFDKFISQNFDWSESVLYYASVEQVNKKESKRRIPANVQVGAKIDFKNKRTWVQAEIISIGPQVLEIQYLNCQNYTKEKVQINRDSRLLAAHHYFYSPNQTKIQTEVQTSIPSVHRQVRRYTRPPIPNVQSVQNVENVPPASAITNLEQPMFEDDRNNWENLFNTPPTYNLWYQQMPIQAQIWEDLLELQQEDNDWIITF